MGRVRSERGELRVLEALVGYCRVSGQFCPMYGHNLERTGAYLGSGPSNGIIVWRFEAGNARALLPGCFIWGGLLRQR